MSTLVVAGIIAGILLLGGCGDSSGGVVVPPAVRPITTNTLRTFMNGDAIQYSVTGSVSSGGVASTFSGSGTYSIALNASPPDPTGTVRSIVGVSLNATFANAAPFNAVSSNYFQQTSTGSLKGYGGVEAGWITSPTSGFVVNMASPVVSPSSWINTFTQQNGDITTIQGTVISRVTVATGLGSFEAFQVQQNGTITRAVGGGVQSSQTDYIVPGIGPVKRVSNATVTDVAGAVSTVQITMSMATTNIGF